MVSVFLAWWLFTKPAEQAAPWSTEWFGLLALLAALLLGIVAMIIAAVEDDDA